jgi:serine/threonine protein kinase
MFESLTGTPPFFADTPVSIIYKHLNQPVPLPSSSIDSIPETVDAIVLRALAKEASQRYENAEAMAQDIMRVLDSGARAGLTAAGIQLSPEQRATIEELRHTNIFERWRLSYAIPLAVLGISALLFLVSDPGPAIFCELESNFLSPSDRVHYLESSADYFISVSRFRAAYRLLTRELQESRAASDKLVQARILSKLALCSFSFDAHKNAAIDHATESLSRSFVYGRETGRFDEAISKAVMHR